MTSVERNQLSDESRDRLGDAIPYYAGGLGVATYDRLLAYGGSPLEGDVDFYKDRARRHGDPVLELGTGTGRVLWPLAQAGSRVTGIDLSTAMLVAAQAKGEAYPKAVRDRVRLCQMDMTALTLDERYALAIVPARAFHHLIAPADQRRCLESIRDHLAPDGILVLDLFDPRLEFCLPDTASPSDGREWRDPETGHLVRRTVVARTCDPVHQRIEERLLFETIDATGAVVAREETQWKLRWVLRQEMRYLFELCGFDIVDEFSDFNGARPAYGREQIWVVRRA